MELKIPASDSNNPTSNTNKSIASYILLAVFLFVTVFILIDGLPKQNEYYYTADEGIYLKQATAIKENGFSGLSKIADEYIKSPNLQLYPTPLRIGHILIIGFLLKISDSIAMLSYYSLLSFIGLIIVSFLFVKKYWGDKVALLTSVFMMFSPINLGIARRALMDSGYTLFTVVSFALFINFINSKKEKHFLYFLSSLTFLLLYKETTYFYLPFFVIALLVIKLIGNDFIDIGHIIKVSVIPMAITFVIYLFSFGSVANIVTIFKAIFMPNFLTPLQYGVDYCSGPWYRYFVDYFMVAPFVSVLFFLYIGYYFTNKEKNISTNILIGFFVYFIIVFSIFFKNIRYGMPLNLVYSLGAALVLILLINLFSKYFINITKNLGINIELKKPLLVIITVLICASQLRIYHKFFVEDKIYDPVSFNLLKSEKFIPSGYNPSSTATNTATNTNTEELAAFQQLGKQAVSTIETPNEANYLNLSLYCFQAKFYPESVKMAEKVLELNPKNVVAYNNICSAYVMLKEYDKAIEAANKALAIDPNFQLAKNNLAWAEGEKVKNNPKK